MKVEIFVKQLKDMGILTLAGIPDSALKPFCDYVNGKGKNEFQHYVPANEGAAVGIAIGNYLATGKPACIYMQNSGIGNAVNPVTSLANGAVYGIPMLMLIGWRGEPGTKDEPQHKFMGSITEELLKVLGISTEIIDGETTESELKEKFQKAATVMGDNGQFAFIIKKDFFDMEEPGRYQNSYPFVREDAIRTVISHLDREDILVSTTGKISREVYEQSNILKGQHNQEFLTVGGMGHASMIALGIAEQKKAQRIYCIDGDGAAFMHMGSLAFIAKQNPGNFVHICMNNEAHESVGGMPTGSMGLDFAEVARACGYPRTYRVGSREELDNVLDKVREKPELIFIEVQVAIQSRNDLGRPTETALENKNNFMVYHGVME